VIGSSSSMSKSTIAGEEDRELGVEQEVDGVKMRGGDSRPTREAGEGSGEASSQ
jgi:hypothetical protein